MALALRAYVLLCKIRITVLPPGVAKGMQWRHPKGMASHILCIREESWLRHRTESSQPQREQEELLNVNNSKKATVGTLLARVLLGGFKEEGLKAWENRPWSSRQMWRPAKVRGALREWNHQGTGLERHWTIPEQGSEHGGGLLRGPL